MHVTELAVSVYSYLLALLIFHNLIILFFLLFLHSLFCIRHIFLLLEHSSASFWYQYTNYEKISIVEHLSYIYEVTQ
jgi:hypothetical protein